MTPAGIEPATFRFVAHQNIYKYLLLKRGINRAALDSTKPETSDFSRKVDENWIFQGYYAACSGNMLTTYRSNLQSSNLDSRRTQFSSSHPMTGEQTRNYKFKK